LVKNLHISIIFGSFAQFFLSSLVDGAISVIYIIVKGNPFGRGVWGETFVFV
jgi:hypothetical protein